MIVDIERIKITPATLETMVSAIANIDTFNVTSISGAPNFGNGSSVTVDAPNGSSGGNNVFDQFYKATTQHALTRPLVERMITDLGGDHKIAANMPSLGTNIVAPAATAPVVQVVTPTPAAAPGA